MARLTKEELRQCCIKRARALLIKLEQKEASKTDLHFVDAVLIDANALLDDIESTEAAYYYYADTDNTPPGC